MSTATLLYDEDCGFCRWVTDLILRWDRRAFLRALPIQSEEGQQLLGSLAPRDRLVSAHLVEPEGTVLSAGALIAPLAERLPGGKPLAAAARVSPAATDFLYRTVARNRTTLGRWIGTQACRVDPAHRRES